MTPLLASPVLAALVIAEHEHHSATADWFAALDSFAVCPITEAGLIRFLLRLGESPQTALEVMSGIRQHPRCVFWPAEVSLTDVAATDLNSADELTEVYLMTLAAAHGERLATLDPGLAARFAERTVLVLR